MRKIKRQGIDNVTTNNLDAALRACGYALDLTLVDRIIDLVELIEEKGDDTSIRDILALQEEWSEYTGQQPAATDTINVFDTMHMSSRSAGQCWSQKRTCTTCMFGPDDSHGFCKAGTHYAELGQIRICYDGELWQPANLKTKPD